METHRCRRGGEGGRGWCEKWWGMDGNYKKGELKKPLMVVKKTCKNMFYKADHRPKRFLCGADHRPKHLVQSGLYNPDYTRIPDFIFRKNTIMT